MLAISSHQKTYYMIKDGVENKFIGASINPNLVEIRTARRYHAKMQLTQQSILSDEFKDAAQLPSYVGMLKLA